LTQSLISDPRFSKFKHALKSKCGNKHYDSADKKARRW
jgi:hypothetical protein